MAPVEIGEGATAQRWARYWMHLQREMPTNCQTCQVAGAQRAQSKTADADFLKSRRHTGHLSLLSTCTSTHAACPRNAASASPTGPKIAFAYSHTVSTMHHTMPKKSSSKSRPRAKGMTQISISLPETLVAKIDAMANAENRNRSNFISNEMVKRVASHAKG